MYFTRRRHYTIIGRRKTLYNAPLDDPDSARSSDELLPYDPENDDDPIGSVEASKGLPKTRHCCGLVVHTPNTSRFKNNIHSRVLQKFPFLIEMFYWIINYAFYRMTSITSQRIFSSTGIWDVAKGHGIAVLEFEQFGWMKFLFPLHERSVQQWFMHGHQGGLTFLNRTYALIHIPGTVGYVTDPFLALALCSQTAQLYSLVLLHCALPSHLCHRPPYLDPNQLPRLYHFYILPLHASTPLAKAVRLPGLRPPRRRAIRLAVRQIRQHPRRNAQHAFRLCLLHRLHPPLSQHPLPQKTRAQRSAQERLLETILCRPGFWISGVDPDDHRCHGKSLLVRCFGGHLLCSSRVSLQ